MSFCFLQVWSSWHILGFPWWLLFVLLHFRIEEGLSLLFPELIFLSSVKDHLLSLFCCYQKVLETWIFIKKRSLLRFT